MTLTDILLLVNVLVVSGVAIWQRGAIVSLREKCATLVDMKLIHDAMRVRVERVEERQAAVDSSMGALPATLAARFKEYVPSTRFTKLENSLDERIAHAIELSQVTPLDKAHRVCSRCGRSVARYKEYADELNTIICANCNPKLMENV